MFDVSSIRIIPDFPKAGINFYDITTLLNNPKEFHNAIQDMLCIAKEARPEVIVAFEARGFFFGSTLAYLLDVPFVPIRKKGKLPGTVFSESYDLEYGQDAIEIHQGSIQPNQRILLIDDILATGGTMNAGIRLVEHFNPTSIDTLFLLELKELKGREKLLGYNVHSLVQL